MSAPHVSVFRITREAPGASADVLVAQGRGPGDAPDDALEVVESPGIRARPVVRGATEALVIELPNGDRFAFVIDKGAKEGAVALEAGETQLRGCAVAASVVRLRASGDIEVTPAEGRNVVLAGGSERVARRNDAVDAGEWSFAAVPNVSTPAPTTDLYIAHRRPGEVAATSGVKIAGLPPSVVVTPGVPPPVPPPSTVAQVGVVAEGAEHVLA